MECAISRIKTFQILKSVFPINMGSELNKIWVICSYLTNFLPPLIVENNAWSFKYCMLSVTCDCKLSSFNV